MRRRDARNLVFLGLLTGFVFGAVDILMTWARPLDDDSPQALLLFYGPMFCVWTAAAFRVAHRARRVSYGVAAAAIVAFATFSAFVLANFLRVNLFLDELAGRADWQDMVRRFHASGTESLRRFVNIDYLQGTSFKIAAATTIGVVLGTIGAVFGRLLPASLPESPSD